MEMHSDHKASNANLSGQLFFTREHFLSTGSSLDAYLLPRRVHTALHIQLARHPLGHCQLLNHELLQALHG